jgi:TolB protein
LAVLLACGVAIVTAGEQAQAAFPGDNGKLAFIRPSPPNGYYALYTINQDGTELTRLVGFPFTHVNSPVWSPDGRKLVFYVEAGTLPDNPEGDSEIYVVNADGTGLTNVTNNAFFDLAPTWSPNGRHIAFVSERGGNREIYVMNADGSGQTRITQSFGSEHTPAWSPDGTKFAFDRDQDIYTMNIDGTNQERLTETPEWEQGPDWSPDGKLIAFARRPGGAGDIYVMNADGTDQTKLTDDPEHDFDPAWSPDGNQIAFESTRDGVTEDIYVMNADGSGVKNVTNSHLSHYRPNWQPIPDPTGPQTKADCKKGGYKNFGFKNQGQCIKAVNQAS